MTDLTNADALGTGLSWTQHWDVETRAGSLGLTSGLDKLGDDLAFSLMQAAREAGLRGRRFNPDLREDARIVARRVANSVSRIETLEALTISEPDDARTTAEVQLTVVANTGARGEFVFPL